MRKRGVAGIAGNRSLVVHHADRHTTTAQAADDAQPLVIAADYNSAWFFYTRRRVGSHFILSVRLNNPAGNAYPRAVLSCSRYVATERASCEVGSSDEIHQWSKTPAGWRTEEMQSRDGCLEVSVQDRKTIGTAD